MKHLTFFIVFAMVLLIVSGFSSTQENGKGIKGLHRPIENQNMKSIVDISKAVAACTQGPGCGRRGSGQRRQKNNEKEEKHKEEGNEESDSHE